MANILKASLLLLLMFTGIGVVRGRDVPAPRRTATGLHFAEISERADTTLIIVYDPEDCFQCDALLSIVQEWAYDSEEKLQFVLTKRPSVEEQKQLRLLWINTEHIAKRGLLRRLIGGRFAPEAILFVNGVEVASEGYRPSGEGVSEDGVLIDIIRDVERKRVEGLHSPDP